MIAAKVEITGIDDVLRTLEAAPKEMRAVARKSMGKASSTTARRMKQKTPTRWRGLVGYRVAIDRRTGGIQARMGYYNAKTAKGKQPKNTDRAFDWFKAYWNNYGTLSKRDPRHVFKFPVKPARWAAAQRRRNRTGIPALHFFEKARQGWEDIFLSAFRAAFDANYEKALGK